jgi:hypothetical protein
MLFLLILLFVGGKEFTVTGRVLDGEGGVPLELAHVRVLGTNLGATTNRDGTFRLILEEGRHRISISYLGFRPETLNLYLIRDTSLAEIYLTPAPIILPEVTVSPRKYSRAEELVLRAIEKKTEVLRDLKSYSFDAYTKTVVRTVESVEEMVDTPIVGILETKTRGFWEYPDRYKEVVEARRQTANFPRQLNMFTAGRIPNFNEDRVVVLDLSVPSPLAKDALLYYSYQIVDSTTAWGRKILRLKVTPKSETVPLFEGTIDIDLETYLVAGVDLTSNTALRRPPFIRLRIKQDFSLYEEKFWLPILIKVEMGMNPPFRVGEIREILMEKSTAITNYRINKPLPVKFDENIFRVLPDADFVDSLTWRSYQVIPLTSEEKQAYWEIDSLMREASPTGKLILSLTKFVLWWQRSPLTSFSDFFHFNRVEGPYLGFGVKFPKFSESFFKLRAGYGLSERVLRYSVGLRRQLGPLGLGFRAGRFLKKRGDVFFSDWEVTLSTLLSKVDPEDYYEGTGFEVSSDLRVSSWMRIGAGYLVEKERSLKKNSDFSLLYPSMKFRENPEIEEGTLRAFTLILEMDTRRFIDMGLFKVEEGGRNYWVSKIFSELAGGDFSYRRLYLEVERYQFLFASTALDLSMALGFSRGELPFQRYFVVKSSSGSFAGRGRLRTVGIDELEGDRLLVLSLSYNMRSLPFKVLKIPMLKDSGLEFILYFGDGRSWKGDKKREVRELGFGLGKLLGFFKLDFTWRLKEGSLHLSLGTG